MISTTSEPKAMEEFLPTLLVTLTFAWLSFHRLRAFQWRERRWLWVSFFGHQLAGLANVWVAKYYYGYGDMLTYHDSGVVIADGLRSDFWNIAPKLVGWIFHQQYPIPLPVEPLWSSSGTMQAVAGISAFALFDSIYAACALFAGIAFFSKISLYTVMREEFPELRAGVLLLCSALVPSVIFWTSSLLKEPIALSAMLFALRAWKDLLDGRSRIRCGMALVFSLTTILVLKGYILPPLAVAAGVWYLLRRVRTRSEDIVFRIWHVLLVCAGAAVLIALTGAFLPSFAMDAVNAQLAQNQSAAQTVEGGTNYSLGNGSASLSSQLALAPLALVTALFRPAIFEAKSLLVFLNALEMTLFTVAFVAVPFRRGITAAFSQIMREPFLGFCATFVVLFGTFTGLGSSNLGTLSRYRAPLVPFFALLLVALLSKKKAAATISPLVVDMTKLRAPRGVRVTN